MKKWKWQYIVALILEIVGLGFIVLAMTTDMRDGLLLPLALVCVGAGNLLSLVMHMRRNRKTGK